MESGPTSFKRAVAAAIVATFTCSLATGGDACKDTTFRFFPPDRATKIKCSSSSARALCSSSGSPVQTIADQLCPLTCGKCDAGGDPPPCKDAPPHIAWGLTLKGNDRNCNWLRRRNGKSCSQGGAVTKVPDAVCPETCGKCGSLNTTTTEKPVVETTTAAPPSSTTTTAAPKNLSATTTATRPPPTTDEPQDGEKHNYAQIMLFWKAQYKWQGTTQRRSWCIECGYNCPSEGGKWLLKPGVCESGDSVRIAECDKSNKRQWWTWEDNSIRPYTNQGLCIDFGQPYFELASCREGDRKQEFISSGFNMGGNEDRNKFELYPQGKKGKHCVTQPHHPRCGEQLKHQDCGKARKHHTNYWIADSPPKLDGHRK